jgi:hypothetical protein
VVGARARPGRRAGARPAGPRATTWIWLLPAVSALAAVRPQPGDVAPPVRLGGPALVRTHGAYGSLQHHSFRVTNVSTRQLTPVVLWSNCSCNDNRIEPSLVLPKGDFTVRLARTVAPRGEVTRAITVIGVREAPDWRGIRLTLETEGDGRPFLMVSPSRLRMQFDPSDGNLWRGLFDAQYWASAGLVGDPERDLHIVAPTEAPVTLRNIRTVKQSGLGFAGRLELSMGVGPGGSRPSSVTLGAAGLPPVVFDLEW